MEISQEFLTTLRPIDLAGEVWKRIPGFEKYEVSNMGRIRSPRGIMKPHKRKDGYYKIQLCVDNVITDHRLHILICSAFNGTKLFPEAKCLHRDDNKDNNTPGNLYWGTPTDNANDIKVNNPEIVRINQQIADDIRRAHQLGESQASIAKRYDIHASHVCNICANRIWRS